MNEDKEFVLNQVLELTEQIAELKFKRESLMDLLKEKPSRQRTSKVRASTTSQNGESRTARILGILDADPEKTFTAKELAKLMGEEVNAIRGAISNLAKSSKLTRVGRGSYQSTKSETINY